MQATQYSDEMHCVACNKRWDVNDPDPPKCIAEGENDEKAKPQTSGRYSAGAYDPFGR